VDTKCHKALLAFYQVRRVTNKTWGASPKVTHWIYTAVIRPMLCYAAVIWWTRTRLSTVSKQLAHMQRIACLYITGAIRTAPTAALELVIGITPVMVYVEQEAMAACLRLKLNSQWILTHTGGHTSICSRLYSNVPLSQQIVDRIMPKFIFDKNYSVFIPARKDWT